MEQTEIRTIFVSRIELTQRRSSGPNVADHLLRHVGRILVLRQRQMLTSSHCDWIEWSMSFHSWSGEHVRSFLRQLARRLFVLNQYLGARIGITIQVAVDEWFCLSLSTYSKLFNGLYPLLYPYLVSFSCRLITVHANQAFPHHLHTLVYRLAVTFCSLAMRRQSLSSTTSNLISLSSTKTRLFFSNGFL